MFIHWFWLITHDSVSMAPALAKEEIYKRVSGPPKLGTIEIPQPNNRLYLFKRSADSAIAQDSDIF